MKLLFPTVNMGMYDDLTVKITLLNVVFSTMERLNETVISNGKHGVCTTITSEIQYILY